MADSLLQEVDQALRADRAAAFWEKNKRRVIGGVVAIVLLAAGDSAYQHYRAYVGGQAMEALMASQKLLASGKPAEAAKEFAGIAAANKGELKSLALVWQSRALLAAEQKEEAIAVLVDAAKGKSLWADIACLRLAGLDVTAATPCLKQPGESPLAGERAQWAAAGDWAAGDATAAKATLETLIADEGTSQEARTRMRQWLALITAQEGKK